MMSRRRLIGETLGSLTDEAEMTSLTSSACVHCEWSVLVNHAAAVPRCSRSYARDEEVRGYYGAEVSDATKF